jgi:hypothetical protein
MLAEASEQSASIWPALGGVLGTIVTAFLAALFAMRYWKKQQYLQQRHAIAYSVVHQAILVRDEFWRARSLVMTGNEVSALKKQYQVTDEQEEEIRQQGADPFKRIGHLGRFWNVQKQFSDLHTKSIELEALLGDEYRDWLRPVEKLLRQFYSAVQLYIDPEYDGRTEGSSYRDLRLIVYGDRSLEDDVFGGEVESAIKRIIDECRIYLIKK